MRVPVETSVLAWAVVDTHAGVVEELRFTPLHENVLVEGVVVREEIGDDDDDDVPAAVAARARSIAIETDLSGVPWETAP